MLWLDASKKSKAIELFNRKEKLLKSDYCTNLTIEQAVHSGYHMLVLKKLSFNELLVFITSLLNELLPYVLNDLTSEQVVDYAESMINDNPYWKPDDFVLCLNNGKRGKYGRSIARWTYQTFNEWCDAYDKERDEFIYTNKHKETNGVREDNKHLVYKERTHYSGKLNDSIPDENYFKKLVENNGK